MLTVAQFRTWLDSLQPEDEIQFSMGLLHFHVNEAYKAKDTLVVELTTEDGHV